MITADYVIQYPATQAPNEPTVTGRLMQARDMMALAEQRTANLRGHLFGEGENGTSRAEPSTVRGMVDDLATRLACLCGELATINSRMGCTPEPVSIHNDAPAIASLTYSTR